MATSVTVMFHSVGLDSHPWAYRHVSEPLANFERKLSALSKSGMKTEFFTDIASGAIEHPAVSLTFDDGYLDNWVHVFPLLDKYQLKATILVSPEFVDPRRGTRSVAPIGSIPAAAHRPADCCAGFLSWDEMRAMEQSGLVDVQSHALTHTWYACGPRIVDYWHPGSATEPFGPVWMLWNRFPELKPHYLTCADEWESKIAYGTPIYEHGKSLETRRFHPHGHIADALVEFVRKSGGGRFFERSDWRQVLATRAAALTEGGQNGEFETESEYRGRVQHELGVSKTILEEQLGKKITGICWPGGGVTEEVVELAKTVGYSHFTLPSSWKADQAKGRYSDMVPRIGSLSKLQWRGRYLGIPSGAEFVWHLQRHQGDELSKWLWRCARALRIATSLAPGSREH